MQFAPSTLPHDIHTLMAANFAADDAWRKACREDGCDLYSFDHSKWSEKTHHLYRERMRHIWAFWLRSKASYAVELHKWVTSGFKTVDWAAEQVRLSKDDFIEITKEFQCHIEK